ncbi:fibronectin type III domain-containing protein [Bacillus cereus]|nr:fibronectin type III domain-containing protein [Bacillus cereus]
MKIKKCGFLLSLVMVVCFALPSFASAEVVDILRGKTGTNGYGGEMTDGKGATCTRIFDGTNIEKVTFDLGLSYTIERFYADASSNNGANLKVTFQNSSRQTLKEFRRVYSADVNLNNVRYVILEPESTSFAVNVCTFSLYANDGKITDVKNLKGTPSSNEISFNWTNPTEETFAGVKVYMDGKLLGTLDKKEISYVAKGLKPNTTYDFKVTSLDSKGVETKGASTKVTTTMPTIEPPNNVHLVSQDSSLIITWDDVKSPYFKGYNVYIDGKKVNSEPLTKSKLNVKGLDNGKSYKVQVATVNTKGVEGAKSKEVSESPSGNALTVDYDVKIPFSPLDLLTSSVSLLAILGGFVLLSIAIIWFRPLKELIVKAVRREKDKK